MTLVDIPETTHIRRPGWLLILTVPAFVAYLGVAVATLAREADSSSAELTPGQIDGLGAGWMAVHLLWVLPSVLAAWGLAGLAGSRHLPRATVVRGLAGIAVALAAAYLIVQLLAFGSGAATWGESPLYASGVVASLLMGWAGTLPATMLVGLALVRRGTARRSAGVVTVLTGLLLVVEVVTYLPALLGPASLAETVGLPPFLYGILWAWLGVAVLRVTSER